MSNYVISISREFGIGLLLCGKKLLGNVYHISAAKFMRKHIVPTAGAEIIRSRRKDCRRLIETVLIILGEIEELKITVLITLEVIGIFHEFGIFFSSLSHLTILIQFLGQLALSESGIG